MITNKQTIFDALEEALRKEGIEIGRGEGYTSGYGDGYAKALADMSEFLTGRQPPEAPKQAATPDDPDRQRRPKGENARRVREALGGATKPLNPSVIRRKVEALQGVPITYSSTRNALLQLKDEGVVVENDGQWSLKQEGEVV